MDNAQLKAFVAVADSQSFSRAADQLHLTQPAVSKRIGNLEAELGQRLFDRVGHAVHLTPAGQTLLPRARRLLQDMDDASTALSNLTGRIAVTRDEIRQRFRMGDVHATDAGEQKLATDRGHRIEHRDPMARLRQTLGRHQAGRASADDGDALCTTNGGHGNLRRFGFTVFSHSNRANAE